MRTGIGAAQAYTAPQVAALWKIALPQEAVIEHNAAAALVTAPSRTACAHSGAAAAHRPAAALTARRHPRVPALLAGRVVDAKRRTPTAQVATAAGGNRLNRRHRHPLLGSAWLILLPLGSLAAAGFAALRRRFGHRSGSGSLPLA